MTNKDKVLCACLGIFGIAGITFGLLPLLQQQRPLEPNSYTATLSASVVINSPQQTNGYGIGETPGVPQPTPSQINELGNAANNAGISAEEMEQLRVQTIQYLESGQAAADLQSNGWNPK
ncbi:MAG: hypothetical protein ABSE48_21795 [Verrucomicrobiota bacterium]|jgi:hypothetical protein